MEQQIVRHLVALVLPRTVPGLIQRAASIVSAMTNNPHFPSPTPKLGAVSAAAAALAEAQSVTARRTQGASAVRDARRKALLCLLQALQGHVQAVADEASSDDAPAIIETAGMWVKKVTPHHKPPIGVKQGPVS